MKLLILLVVSACIAGTASAANTPGLAFNYYEGTWNTLPNFFTISPVKKGVSTNIDMSVRKSNASYAFLWQGSITITVAANYTFETNSDDGSRLFIGTYSNSNTPVVNNDGIHAAKLASGVTYLKAGTYPITIEYFQKDGGQTMEVYWSSDKGLARQKIPSNVLSHATYYLDYSYYQGNWSALPNFNSLKPIKKGTSKYMDLSVRGRDTGYAVMWKGFLTIPAAGNYTFETVSDDGSKLSLDTANTVLVNNDGMHTSKSASGSVTLAAGTYPFTISFFQNNGGQTLDVYWRSNTGISRQLIPEIAFSNSPSVVNYSYYEGTWNSLPDFSTLTPLITGMGANIDLNIRKRDTSYAMVWRSFISIPTTGDYTFETNSDDGSRVYIDNNINNSNTVVAVVNNDGLHAPTTAKGTIHLTKGAYPITVSFFQNGGGNTMELYWSSNTGIKRQLVPDKAFVPGLPMIAVANTVPVDTVAQGEGLKGIHNYYFSSSTGDDSRTSAQAQNPSTPWQSINQLNAFLPNLLPGDAVLFKRGDLFSGAIVVTKSGAVGAPIIFSSYGKGPKPIINGFSNITGWTALGGNIFEAPFMSGGYLSLVTVNDKLQTKGRYPNSDYLTIDSRTEVDGPAPKFTGPGTFTDADLPASVTNWTGAEVVIRKNDYVLDRCLITGHSGTTVSYYSPSPHTPVVGYGYFIQNDPRTLDIQGEWYYDAPNHKLKIYSKVDPATLNVKASFISSLLTIDNKSNIIIDNFQFQGSDTAAINITNSSSDISIQNCEIDFSGIAMLNASNSNYISFLKNSVNDSNSPSVYMVDCSNSVIKDNIMKNMGLQPGMGLSNFAGYGAVYAKGSYNTVMGNRIDSIGYNGIVVTGGSNLLVKNNVVSNFCMVLADGGGIYTNADDNFLGRQIIGNIVLNGAGSYKGTTATTPRAANGIYLDELGSNVDVFDNTVYNVVSNGIYLHQAYNNTIRGNTLVANGLNALSIVDDMPWTARIRNNVVKSNIFYAKTASQRLLNHGSTANDLTLFGQYDSNYYCRPLDVGGYITTQYKNPNDVYSFYDLAAWRETYKDRGNNSVDAPPIKPYIVTAQGKNLIVNGTFNDNVNNVFVDGNLNVSLDTKLDGKAALISNKGAAVQADNVTVIEIGPVTVGTLLRIRFSLLGSKSTQNLISYVRAYNDPYYPIVSEIKSLPMRTTRTECEYFYKATTNEPDVKLTFVSNGNLMPYWIDNVEVTPVTGTPTNIDDSVRFEYNASNVVKTVSLNGVYTDYKKNVYNNKVNIDPYSSVVLTKVNSNAGLLATTGVDSVKTFLTAVMLNDTKSRALDKSSVYPNPATSVLATNLSTTKMGNLSLTILDGSGKVVQTSEYSKRDINFEKTMNVGTLHPGLYYMQIKFSDGSSMVKPFLKN